MYSPPMADTRPGRAWATKCAIARAGTAPRATPEMPRSTSSTANDGASGTRMPAVDATTAEIVMARARPIRSAMAAHGSTDRANAPVATDTANETVDSVSCHSSAMAGSTACTA